MAISLVIALALVLFLLIWDMRDEEIAIKTLEKEVKRLERETTIKALEEKILAIVEPEVGWVLGIQKDPRRLPFIGHECKAGLPSWGYKGRLFRALRGEVKPMRCWACNLNAPSYFVILYEFYSEGKT